MEPFAFTPEVIAATVGLILTLFFSYFPKIRVLYGGLSSSTKSLIMLGLLLVAEVVIATLAYYGVIQTDPPIGTGSTFLFRCLTVAFSLLVSNQPVYNILPEAGDVREAKLLRDGSA